MALSRRNSDGQSVRIPTDGSRDVQASFQDVKDALRAMEAKYSALKDEFDRLSSEKAVSTEKKSINFNEVNEETIFNSPVTFGSAPTIPGYIKADGTVDYTASQGFDAGSASSPGIRGLGNSSNTGIGIGLGGDDIMAFSSNGTIRWTLSAAGVLIPYASNTYDIGTSSYSVQNIYLGSKVIGLEEAHGCNIVNYNTFSSDPQNTVFWVAPYTCTVQSVSARVVGGTSAACRPYHYDGATNYLRGSAQTITSGATFTALTSLTNTSISAGAQLHTAWTSVTGAVTQLALTIVVKRT